MQVVGHIASIWLIAKRFVRHWLVAKGFITQPAWPQITEFIVTSLMCGEYLPIAVSYLHWYYCYFPANWAAGASLLCSAFVIIATNCS